MRVRFLLATLSALLSCLPCRAVETPQPVPAGGEAVAPYALTGAVATYESYGSGVVAAHPRVMLSCAHVAFSLYYLAWMSGAEFFPAWNQGSEPPPGTGALLSGYYYWRSYASAAATTERLYAAGRDTLAAEVREFSQDFVAYFHHSRDLAGGNYARVLGDGVSLLANGKYTKIITGYPSGNYLPGDPDEFRMHQTVFTDALRPETKVSRRYLTAYEVAETGSGNSGGPVWVETGGLAVAGVLVSGQEKPEYEQSMVGVHAVSPEGWRLIQSALDATSLAPPAVRSFELADGTIPDGATLVRKVKVSGLPKTIMSATLDLEIEHPLRGDLTVTVRGPGRRSALVYDGLADDEAGTSIRLSGEQVAYFYGANPNGVWTVLIDDWELQDEGRLVSARLNISAR